MKPDIECVINFTLMYVLSSKFYPDKPIHWNRFVDKTMYIKKK